MCIRDSIGVADTEANAPWFYADRSWKQDRGFHVLTDVQHILSLIHI